ncbi:hypothetical protein K491DRAFT_517882 [Lophiostoma macrostomum CBS 122681]|uniref:Uncharacterized protein n=1 Tax=Lophiostoma macrostomum CBS 122681 TaxID=1314788 RepID=A0A6A6T216_9PLEO|nr:hypothetical protein K491DRAFT_517882 [Lophiostoma macrostomum CBS 122681]
MYCGILGRSASHVDDPCYRTSTTGNGQDAQKSLEDCCNQHATSQDAFQEHDLAPGLERSMLHVTRSCLHIRPRLPVSFGNYLGQHSVRCSIVLTAVARNTDLHLGCTLQQFGRSFFGGLRGRTGFQTKNVKLRGSLRTQVHRQSYHVTSRTAPSCLTLQWILSPIRHSRHLVWSPDSG